MKRLAVLMAVVALLLISMLSFAACRKLMPTNRYLQPRRAPVSMGTTDARRHYDHELHSTVVAAHGQTCGDCHRFDVIIDSGEAALAKDLSAHALNPGGAACHYCHGPGDTKLYNAPGACTTCHTNLAPLRPVDHDVAWMRVHASVAQAQPGTCENCHRQTECITCHETRDTIQTLVHERNFLTFHSIEARANPMQCGSCHRQDYCIRCHQQGDAKVRP